MKTLKTLFAAGAAAMMTLTAQAANTAKAVLSDSGKTLTFVYDAKSYGTKGTDWFSVAEAVAQDPADNPPWYGKSYTKVVFDASFAFYQPKHCGCWFYDATALTSVEGLHNLDVSAATSLCYMFENCSKLTELDLSTWNTTNVTDMSEMFLDCSKLTTIYASDEFTVASVSAAKSANMFTGCKALVGGLGTKYVASLTNKTYARVDKVDDPGYFTLKAPTVIWDSKKNTLTFYFKPAKELPQGGAYHRFYMPVEGYAPDWLYWNAQTILFAAEKVVFDSSFATYRPKCCYMWFFNLLNLTDIVGLNYLDVSRVTNLYGFVAMFAHCYKLETLDLSNFDTRQLSMIVSMMQMFDGCSSLKTIYATDAFVVKSKSSDMFKGCTKLKGGNDTAWSAEAALDKTYAKVDRDGEAGYFTAAPVAVFDGAGTMTLYADGEVHDGTAYSAVSRDSSNLTPWFNRHNAETTNIVVDASFAAYRPKSCRQWFENLVKVTSVEGLENLDLSETENMYYMFYNCSSLKSFSALGQSGANQVKDMRDMFAECRQLQYVDLSHFNTASVTNMSDMFLDCGALRTIYASEDFVTTGLLPDPTYQSMFWECSSLVGGNGTTIYTSGCGSTALYARIDKEGQKGLFTLKGSDSVAEDLDGNGLADVVMTIDSATHAYDGATGAWLIQNDQTPAWGDLSTRNAGWKILGTGVSAAGKTTKDVYLVSADNVVGAWVTGTDGQVTGWETVGSFDAQTTVGGLGDFNGDGQSDLLLVNDNGAIGCYFTSGSKTGWNYFQSLGSEWRICGIGDLNGDGRDDLVLLHDAGFAGSWLTQADGTMAWADLDTLTAGYEIVGCGDFNGDGTDDVLLRSGNYYGAWLVQNGNASDWMGLGDLGSVTVEQIADFDGDGADDLRIRTAAGDLGAECVKGEDNLEWHYYGSVGDEWNTEPEGLK